MCNLDASIVEKLSNVIQIKMDQTLKDDINLYSWDTDSTINHSRPNSKALTHVSKYKITISLPLQSNIWIR